MHDYGRDDTLTVTGKKEIARRFMHRLIIHRLLDEQAARG